MALNHEPLGSTSDLVSLTELPGVLRPFADSADTAAQVRIRYQALWTRCCDGTIPAEKIGGRWFIRRGWVPEIAKVLGLKVPAAAKRAQRAPSNVAAA